MPRHNPKAHSPHALNAKSTQSLRLGCQDITPKHTVSTPWMPRHNPKTQSLCLGCQGIIQNTQSLCLGCQGNPQKAHSLYALDVRATPRSTQSLDLASEDVAQQVPVLEDPGIGGFRLFLQTRVHLVHKSLFLALTARAGKPPDEGAVTPASVLVDYCFGPGLAIVYAF